MNNLTTTFPVNNLTTTIPPTPANNPRIWYADFETTQPTDKKEVTVYLWCAVNGKKRKTGTTISSFFDFCKKLKGHIIYFHNLKFDFSYIQYHALLFGIEHEILERRGKIYSVNLFNVQLRDSTNFFVNMSLREVGEKYCYTYKKTGIDHTALKDHIATPQEIEYCYNDCLIMQEAINRYLTTLKETLHHIAPKTAKNINRKLTNSGISFSAFSECSNFLDTVQELRKQSMKYIKNLIVADMCIRTRKKIITYHSLIVTPYIRLCMHPLICLSVEEYQLMKMSTEITNSISYVSTYVLS